MPVEITVPSPGESISQVVLGPWHKRSGQWVEKDEPLVDIESDKTTLEVPAPASGMLDVKAEQGAERRVGDVIGTIDPRAARPGSDGHESAGSAATKAPPHASGAPEARITPVARKVAADKGVPIEGLQGTGPSGRIRKSDVLAAASSAAPMKVAASALVEAREPAPTMPLGPRASRREKMSRLRQTIASRLVAAQHAAAMLTTFNEADMTEVMRLRSEYKEGFEKKHGVSLGFMSFFVKACASALAAFPRVNASIIGDEVEYHDYVDISVAVGTDKGLVVPVLRDCQRMSFAEIELGIKALAAKARDGRLTVEEMTGGTFTISNGGVYGSLNSTPILNPPQSGILGMHKIMKRPIEYPSDSGQVALRPMMCLALSYDHRLVDGAEAVSFLVHVKHAVENPERLLLEV